MDEIIKDMQEQLETGIRQAFNSVPKELWVMLANAIEESITKVCEEKKTESTEYMAELIIASNKRLHELIQRIREEEL